MSPTTRSWSTEEKDRFRDGSAPFTEPVPALRMDPMRARAKARKNSPRARPLEAEEAK